MAIDYLYPNSTEASDHSTPVGAATIHECLDDPQGSPDDEATRVNMAWGAGAPYLRCGFTTITVGAVNSVTAHFRSRRTGDTPIIKTFVRINGTRYFGPNENANAAWTDYSKTWNLNPDTSVAWTQADINALELGLLQNPNAAGTDHTQLYAAIDFTPPDGGGGAFLTV